jgi:hypothetical protein
MTDNEGTRTDNPASDLRESLRVMEDAMRWHAEDEAAGKAEPPFLPRERAEEKSR